MHCWLLCMTLSSWCEYIRCACMLSCYYLSFVVLVARRQQLLLSHYFLIVWETSLGLGLCQIWVRCESQFHGSSAESFGDRFRSVILSSGGLPSLPRSIFPRMLVVWNFWLIGYTAPNPTVNLDQTHTFQSANFTLPLNSFLSNPTISLRDIPFTYIHIIHIIP